MGRDAAERGHQRTTADEGGSAMRRAARARSTSDESTPTMGERRRPHPKSIPNSNYASDDQVVIPPRPSSGICLTSPTCSSKISTS